MLRLIPRTAIFRKAVFQVKPWEAAVVIDVGAGLEGFWVRERGCVEVDFACVVVCLKGHRCPARVAEVAGDAGGRIVLFRGFACPFKSIKGRTEKRRNRSGAIAAAIGAMAIAGPCLRTRVGKSNCTAKAMACGIGHDLVSCWDQPRPVTPLKMSHTARPKGANIKAKKI